MAITKDQVFAEADQMFADGEAPTLIALRARLGSGSYSTISAFLSEWKAASRADVIEPVSMPQELDAVASGLAKTFWSACWKLSLSNSQLVEKDAQLKVDAAVNAQREALEVAQQVQNEFDDLFAANVRLLERCQIADDKVIELQKELAVSTALLHEVRQFKPAASRRFVAKPKARAKP